MNYQFFGAKPGVLMPEKEENTYQPSHPLNQPTKTYSALKTWKLILSAHLLFCAHAKRNKNPFSFVVQMRVEYLETGLYFLNAMELWCFRSSWDWQMEEVTGRKYCGLQICCLNATYINLSTIREVYWSPRATTISAEASVCLWSGTKRSLAGGDKLEEVAQSLWPFPWHYKTGSTKKYCLKHTIRGWDFASWCRFWQSPGCDVLLWVRASTTEPMALCRNSTRIKVSISKHGSMAHPTQEYNLRLNYPN